ncbi:MAG TPA: di-heme oxidoredictase family protein [Cellvibrionaceae bacterium]
MWRHTRPVAAAGIKTLSAILALGMLSISAVGLANPLLPGGLTSVSTFEQNAYSQPAANMPLQRRLDFSVGQTFFRNPWVPAPSSTDARDGLGPLFNANSCQSCHVKNGRGKAPLPNENLLGLIIRISVPPHKPMANHLGVQPEPTYGNQLHDRSIAGVPPEARLHINYVEVPITLADGSQVSLRKPQLQVSDLAYGPLAENTQFSLRLAPSMIGLGLLAAIDENALIQLEDPSDKNRDGISGRRNRVWDKTLKRYTTGRFGWKAGQPSLAQQNALAFAEDLGISNPLVTASCPNSELANACREAISGGEPELAANLAHQVEFFTANLAVPKTRPIPVTVKDAGAALFTQLKCAACHVPRHITGTVQNMPWLTGQTIYPYTDLLLHDMGEGLADNHSEFGASGAEWRTPPLWGIGLAQAVNPAAGFLHDGRARSLEEAILWHDGEAAASRAAYSQLNTQQRSQLLSFVEHL